MAHFAKIDDTNIVREVIVISNADCGGGDFPASEPIGQAFIKEIIRNIEMVFIMCRPYVWRACMSVRLMRVVLPLNHQRGV